MQITIELPDDIAQRLAQTVDNLPQRALESLVVEAYRDELLTHAEVGRILNLPSRWAIDAFSNKQEQIYTMTQPSCKPISKPCTD
jgi:hypothetical protein